MRSMTLRYSGQLSLVSEYPGLKTAPFCCTAVFKNWARGNPKSRYSSPTHLSRPASSFLFLVPPFQTPVRGKLSPLACKYSTSYPAFFQRIRNRERVGRFWFRAKIIPPPSHRPLHQRLTFPWSIAQFSLFST